MLYSYTRAWTPAQKWLIASSVAAMLVVVAASIYAYELHLRRGIEDILVDHEWSIEGCMDCTSDLTFRHDHTLHVEEFGVGSTFTGSGTWQLSGRDTVVLDYDIKMDDSTLQPQHAHRSLHIARLTPTEFVADTVDGGQILYTRAH
jgi:hypothetical protein